METDPSVWLPHSFFRRPEWRWLRAEHLIATGRRRDPRVDDPWVSHARTALRGRGGAGSKAAAVRAAREVWTGNPAVKGELEALLLTEEPFDRVADRLGLPVTTVEAYAAAFFAVGSMRHATDWLMARAVGYSPLSGFTSPLPWSAWRLAALTSGRLFLDVVIAATAGRPLPEGFLKETGRRRAYEDARVRLLARLWVALMAARTDEEFARVVVARRQLRDLDARVTGRVGTVAPTVAAMEKFLTALPAMLRKARITGGRGEGAWGTSSPSTPRASGTGQVAGPAPLDSQRAVDVVEAAVGAVQDALADHSPRTTNTGQATGGMPVWAKPEGLAGAHRPRRLAG